MKLDDLLNVDRVRALQSSPNAYVNPPKDKNNVHINEAQKIIFPEPYENASHYYNRNQFSKPVPPDPPPPPEQHNNMPFDIKSLLPMLMSGKMDILKPLMSMFSGGASSGEGMDLTKIFELFKPKQKPKKEENKEEDVSSKFDDMIIIED